MRVLTTIPRDLLFVTFKVIGIEYKVLGVEKKSCMGLTTKIYEMVMALQ